MTFPRLTLCAAFATACAAPLPATIDRNLDGVSDVWSALHPTAGAPSADPDGDGASNLAESIAGTDPLSSASGFTAALDTDAAGNLSLRWREVAGKRYSVEASAEFRTWLEFPCIQAPAGANLTAIVRPAGTSAGSAKYWRVVVADSDADGDGLNDWEEQRRGTEREEADTDGDGFSDGFEVAYGFDPEVAETGAREIQLWTDTAPIGGDATEPAASYNALTISRATGGDGSAFVICPGGGYAGWMIGDEGTYIGTWLQSHGITGCTLRYRLPAGRAEVPLLDAQRALRFLRAHAADLGLNSRRIGIIGFSAGGHLAGSAATLYDAGDLQAVDPVERVSSRPDFAVLVYPVVSMTDALTHDFSRQQLLGVEAHTPSFIQRFSVEQNITANTPPMYLAHAVDDTVVSIENSRALAVALAAKGIPHLLLELPDGGHGLQYNGNYYSGPSWEAWKAGSLAWINALPTPGP